MSELEALRDDLRDRAAKKRTAAFDTFNKKSNPPNLAVVLSELTDVLKSLQQILAAQSSKTGPLDFEVTERELNGDVRTFRVK